MAGRVGWGQWRNVHITLETQADRGKPHDPGQSWRGALPACLQPPAGPQRLKAVTGMSCGLQPSPKDCSVAVLVISSRVSKGSGCHADPFDPVHLFIHSFHKY